ncbi:hypothetical protein BB559_004900 [Furculomyces boomerangus]|uniref:Uncharacterized protein n=1 Tax=Furculomyces boomerangus TaxID=61424 RepID=A0A2T9YBX8_9FUNG|nr:hypothetical protein BB559_004900 [Furculomyces boomerangus]
MIEIIYTNHSNISIKSTPNQNMSLKKTTNESAIMDVPLMFFPSDNEKTTNNIEASTKYSKYSSEEFIFENDNTSSIVESETADYTIPFQNNNKLSHPDKKRLSSLQSSSIDRKKNSVNSPRPSDDSSKADIIDIILEVGIGGMLSRSHLDVIPGKDESSNNSISPDTKPMKRYSSALDSIHSSNHNGKNAKPAERKHSFEFGFSKLNSKKNYLIASTPTNPGPLQTPTKYPISMKDTKTGQKHSQSLKRISSDKLHQKNSKSGSPVSRKPNDRLKPAKNYHMMENLGFVYGGPNAVKKQTNRDIPKKKKPKKNMFSLGKNSKNIYPNETLEISPKPSKSINKPMLPPKTQELSSRLISLNENRISSEINKNNMKSDSGKTEKNLKSLNTNSVNMRNSESLSVKGIENIAGIIPTPNKPRPMTPKENEKFNRINTVDYKASSVSPTVTMGNVAKKTNPVASIPNKNRNAANVPKVENSFRKALVTKSLLKKVSEKFQFLDNKVSKSRKLEKSIQKESAAIRNLPAFLGEGNLQAISKLTGIPISILSEKIKTNSITNESIISDISLLTTLSKEDSVKNELYNISKFVLESFNKNDGGDDNDQEEVMFSWYNDENEVTSEDETHSSSGHITDNMNTRHIEDPKNKVPYSLSDSRIQCTETRPVSNLPIQNTSEYHENTKKSKDPENLSEELEDEDGPFSLLYENFDQNGSKELFESSDDEIVTHNMFRIKIGEKIDNNSFSKEQLEALNSWDIPTTESKEKAFFDDVSKLESPSKVSSMDIKKSSLRKSTPDLSLILEPDNKNSIFYSAKSTYPHLQKNTQSKLNSRESKTASKRILHHSLMSQNGIRLSNMEGFGDKFVKDTNKYKAEKLGIDDRDVINENPEESKIEQNTKEKLHESLKKGENIISPTKSRYSGGSLDKRRSDRPNSKMYIKIKNKKNADGNESETNIDNDMLPPLTSKFHPTRLNIEGKKTIEGLIHNKARYSRDSSIEVFYNPRISSSSMYNMAGAKSPHRLSKMKSPSINDTEKKYLSDTNKEGIEKRLQPLVLDDKNLVTKNLLHPQKEEKEEKASLDNLGGESGFLSGILSIFSIRSKPSEKYANSQEKSSMSSLLPSSENENEPKTTSAMINNNPKNEPKTEQLESLDTVILDPPSNKNSLIETDIQNSTTEIETTPKDTEIKEKPTILENIELIEKSTDNETIEKLRNLSVDTKIRDKSELEPENYLRFENVNTSGTLINPESYSFETEISSINNNVPQNPSNKYSESTKIYKKCLVTSRNKNHTRYAGPDPDLHYDGRRNTASYQNNYINDETCIPSSSKPSHYPESISSSTSSGINNEEMSRKSRSSSIKENLDEKVKILLAFYTKSIYDQKILAVHVSQRTNDKGNFVGAKEYMYGSNNVLSSSEHAHTTIDQQNFTQPKTQRSNKLRAAPMSQGGDNGDSTELEEESSESEEFHVNNNLYKGKNEDKAIELTNVDGCGIDDISTIETSSAHLDRGVFQESFLVAKQFLAQRIQAECLVHLNNGGSSLEQLENFLTNEIIRISVGSAGFQNYIQIINHENNFYEDINFENSRISQPNSIDKHFTQSMDTNQYDHYNDGVNPQHKNFRSVVPEIQISKRSSVSDFESQSDSSRVKKKPFSSLGSNPEENKILKFASVKKPVIRILTPPSSLKDDFEHINQICRSYSAPGTNSHIESRRKSRSSSSISISLTPTSKSRIKSIKTTKKPGSMDTKSVRFREKDMLTVSSEERSDEEFSKQVSQKLRDIDQNTDLSPNDHNSLKTLNEELTQELCSNSLESLDYFSSPSILSTNEILDVDEDSKNTQDEFYDVENTPHSKTSDDCNSDLIYSDAPEEISNSKEVSFSVENTDYHAQNAELAKNESKQNFVDGGSAKEKTLVSDDYKNYDSDFDDQNLLENLSGTDNDYESYESSSDNTSTRGSRTLSRSFSSSINNIKKNSTVENLSVYGTKIHNSGLSTQHRNFNSSRSKILSTSHNKSRSSIVVISNLEDKDDFDFDEDYSDFSSSDIELNFNQEYYADTMPLVSESVYGLVKGKPSSYRKVQIDGNNLA